jgi:hypothetical protein
MQITNVYLVNVRSAAMDSRVQDFNPSSLPTSRNYFICGDFNAHHPSWDTSITNNTTPLGNQLHEWATDKHFICANDGTPTRINPASGNPSTPDATFHHASWHGKVNWKVIPDQWGSDHHPITISISTDKRLPPKKVTWSYKKADWDLFQGCYNAGKRSLQNLRQTQQSYTCWCSQGHSQGEIKKWR